MSLITVERKVLESNDAIAEDNRKNFQRRKIFAINIVSSPGAGKTSIIEKTISILKDNLKIGFIVGDIQTSLDAQRIDKLGIPSVQIVTNGACHIDANLIKNAFNEFNDLDLDLLIIENVGNLVCPAEFDLGEEFKVVIASVADGDEKPLKYPLIFRESKCMLLNKIDLLPYLNCSVDELYQNSLSINPNLIIFKTSCTTNDGIDEWCEWLQEQMKNEK